MQAATDGGCIAAAQATVRGLQVPRKFQRGFVLEIQNLE
jgi:hypothetical protein